MTTILWYENAQSIADKIELAQMFGVDTLSIWRIGAIPTDTQNQMDIWSAIQAQLH